MLRPVIGARLDGATLTAADTPGVLGAPTWGPLALLRDLELRLGLAAPEPSATTRVAAWRTRLAHLLDDEPFYAASYRIDPLGTADMLLAWRDSLIDAGWDGSAVRGGGPRLDALARLEALAPALPPGAADRLARVESTLGLAGDAPYDALTLADELTAWPLRWRRVIATLQAAGTTLGHLPRDAACAPPGTDLEHLQRLLHEDRVATRPTPMHGDGSLLLLQAPTAHEVAEAIAALLRTWPGDAVALIRGGETATLDHALAAHGLGALGHQPRSPWRAAGQLLPLLVDLAFEPLDPRRLLELMDLRINPLPPQARYRMARALSDAPGVGGARWQTAKRRLADAGEPIDELERWVETRRFDAAGAPRDELALLANRIAAWLGSRLGGARGDSLAASLAAAHEQTQAFLHLLATDPRDQLDRIAVRSLLDVAVGDGTATDVLVEAAGRLDHVDDPAGLLASRDHVIWWQFVAGSTRPPHRSRWRRVELDALAAAGVEPIATATLLAEESRAWRAAALQARQHLILVAPGTNRGERQSPHPFWDEIVARLQLDEHQQARITATAADLLARRRWRLDVEALPALPLPAARPAWQVPPGAIAIRGPLAPYAIEELVECPLRWVLGSSGERRAATVPAIPEGSHLNGQLGHRLIEALVEHGALGEDPEVIGAVFDQLLPGAAASLLLPGMNMERHQLRHQLIAAATRLAGLLRRAGLELVASEQELEASWHGVRLTGRLDLRLRSRAGGDEALVDFKWSRGRSLEQLKHGRALQLAMYAALVRDSDPAGRVPAAGYFCLSRGQLLTTEPSRFGGEGVVAGPPVSRTIAAVGATLPLVRDALDEGRVVVTGVDGAPGLLDALGVPEAQQPSHFPAENGSACATCRFPAVCGRAWSGHR